MADPGMFRSAPLQGWQRANIVAAANYLRELIAFSPEDAILRSAYEGLLDLLDPSRMVTRRQREMADAAKQAATSIKQVRRSTDRRRGRDRRVAHLGAPGGVERRAGAERRTRDRRK